MQIIDYFSLKHLYEICSSNMIFIECSGFVTFVIVGVGPFEVKLVLSSVVNDKLITLDEINGRISTFPYGPTDAKQRPSSIPNLNCDGMVPYVLKFGICF